jgi:hypothetical protein
LDVGLRGRVQHRAGRLRAALLVAAHDNEDGGGDRQNEQRSSLHEFILLRTRDE